MASNNQAAPITVDRKVLDESVNQWALAIGQFLVAFTGCEYWTYAYVRTFGSEALHDAVANQNLAPRAAVARALVGDLGLKLDIQKRVDAAFQELSDLAKPRNLVAHNPPMFHIYADEQGQYHFQHELRSVKDNSKEITKEGLAELAARASKLDEEFALLYGEVRQPQNREGGSPTAAA